VDPFEQLRIDTPEQIALELPVAGIGSRFLAVFVDTLIQGVLYVLAFLVLVAAPSLLRPLIRLGPVAWVAPALLVLFAFSVSWGYFTLFEIMWHGQTPGKRAAGIRVIKETGRPIDIPSAILRNLLRAIDFLPALYGVGVTCMLLNRHSRRLGDFVAGTIVVHDRAGVRLATVSHAWTPSGPTIPLAPATATPARITPRDVMLIEAYLGRRFELDDLTQDASARQIAKLIASRTGLTPAPGQSVNDFLETVAQRGRDQ
jgi:uncharacterized RDD family membrane protein YckC